MILAAPIDTATTATDHSAAIRAEIERDVERLIAQCRAQARRWETDGWWAVYDDTPKAHQVRVGYTINMHRGRDLYVDGDVIAGLRVVVDRELPRTITVQCEEMMFKREVMERDYAEEGGASVILREEWRRPEASITW